MLILSLQVRATAIVEQAQDDGIPSPVISIPSLNRCQVSFVELKGVLDLQYLVRFIKLLVTGNRRAFEPFGDYLYDERTWDRKTEALASSLWHMDFHAAFYKIFLAAAVLARSYQEPFYVVPGDHPRDFLEDFPTSFTQGLRKLEWMHSPVEGLDEQIEYISRFDAYDLENYEKQSIVFGHFADWFMSDCQKKADERRATSPDLGKADHWVVSREVAKLLFAYTWAGQNHNIDHFERKGLYAVRHHYEEDWEDDEELPARPVNVVMFGDFCLQEIATPKDYTRFRRRYLVAGTRHVESPKCPVLPDLRALVEYIYLVSGKPNHRVSTIEGRVSLAPPPFLHMFDFMARKYFNKQFASVKFDLENHAKPLYKVTSNAFVFGDLELSKDSLRADFNDMFEDVQLPPVLSFHVIR